MTTFNHRSPKTFTTLALLGILTVSTAVAPQSAQADHPVAVAAIGAGGLVAAAIIGAAGAIGAAAIAGAADVVVAAIDANSNGGEGGGEIGDGDGDGGGEGGGEGGGGEGQRGGSGDRFAAMNALEQGCFATLPGGGIQGAMGASKTLNISGVPLNMQPFMQRSIDLKIGTDQANQTLGALVDYHFDGDVMKSPNFCDYVYNSDTITWHLELRENPNSQNDYFMFHFEELVLTTTDVPDTFGRSSVVFKVFQGQNQIWQWEASARQGFASTHSPVPPFSTVTKSAGELMIENFLAPIPVTFPPNSNKTQVRIEMTYQGRGTRF